jgi:hypothetical protein
MQAVMEQRRKMAEWHKSNAPLPRPGGAGGGTPQGAAGVPAGRMTENKVVDPVSGESFYSEVCHMSLCVCGVVVSVLVILCACRRVRVHVGELRERGRERRREKGREGGRERGEERSVDALMGRSQAPAAEAVQRLTMRAHPPLLSDSAPSLRLRNHSLLPAPPTGCRTRQGQPREGPVIFCSTTSCTTASLRSPLLYVVLLPS